MSLPISRALLFTVLLGVFLAACSGAASETTVPETTTSPTTEAPVTVPETTAAPTTVATTVPATAAPSTTEPPPAVVEIVVADGVIGGPGQIEAALGDQIQFVVISDVADEVHVHGYDIFSDVEPGVPAAFSFVADIPGIFEVELEIARELLVELVVQ